MQLLWFCCIWNVLISMAMHVSCEAWSLVQNVCIVVCCWLFLCNGFVQRFPTNSPKPMPIFTWRWLLQCWTLAKQTKQAWTRHIYICTCTYVYIILHQRPQFWLMSTHKLWLSDKFRWIHCTNPVVTVRFEA